MENENKKYDIEFCDYVHKEMLRLACGRTERVEQITYMFEEQPRLETALMLDALCHGKDDADALLHEVVAFNTPDGKEQHQKRVIEHWTELLTTLGTFSSNDLSVVFKDADGDLMAGMGFPIPYAKYADTWIFWREEQKNVESMNDVARRTYIRQVEQGRLSDRQLAYIFGDITTYEKFIAGFYSYSIRELGEIGFKKKETLSWDTAT